MALKKIYLHLPWWLCPMVVSVCVFATFWLIERPYCIFGDGGSNGSKLEWSPYMDVLAEEDAFRKPKLMDPKQAVKDLIVELKDGVHHFTVGETIYVDMQAYDYFGSFRPFGGDHIRIRMADRANHAYSSGYVLDHGNGSYTGVLKALWEGNPTIFIEIVYTREEITYLYELRRKLPTLRNNGACFNDNGMYEFRVCLPFPGGLDQKKGICDLSSLNGGMPWFCQMPETPGLVCKHVSFVFSSKYNRTEIENAVDTQFWRNEIGRRTELRIFIQDKQLKNQDAFKRPPCPNYDREKLWYQPSPVGYFYNGSWLLSHCRGEEETRPLDCLTDKTIFLYGDSTLKQWYTELKNRSNCTHDTFHSNDSGSICKNYNINLSIYFIPHNLPGANIYGNFGFRTFEGLSDLILQRTKPVFVIHLFSHYTLYHHNVYRERIKRLRHSIETILTAYPNAQFLLKGPHTFRSRYIGVSDYYAYVYRPILTEEMKGLRNTVVYLDYKDMSIAKQVDDLHPDPDFVNAMVDQMMAYVC